MLFINKEMNKIKGELQLQIPFYCKSSIMFIKT